MTNISRKNLNNTNYQELASYLLRVIGGLKTDNSRLFLDDLLTASEQIMLTKRFGAVVLFSRGHSVYDVSQLVGVSIPTASRLYKQFCNGTFDNLLNILKPKRQNEVTGLLVDFLLSRASPDARKRLQRRLR